MGGSLFPSVGNAAHSTLTQTTNSPSDVGVGLFVSSKLRYLSLPASLRCRRRCRRVGGKGTTANNPKNDVSWDYLRHEEKTLQTTSKTKFSFRRQHDDDDDDAADGGGSWPILRHCDKSLFIIALWKAIQWEERVSVP
jgi:hypothetical protein